MSTWLPPCLHRHKPFNAWQYAPMSLVGSSTDDRSIAGCVTRHANGKSCVQVHKAFEYLQKAEEVDKPDRWYDVRVKRTDSTQPSQRGIYLRDPWHSRRPVSFICEVKPNMRRVCPRSMLTPHQAHLASELSIMQSRHSPSSSFDCQMEVSHTQHAATCQPDAVDFPAHSMPLDLLGQHRHS